MRKISAKKRKHLTQKRLKWEQRWRNKFREIHCKKIDFVTHSYEDGYFYINLYFTDKTNFSLDFSIAQPAIVPRIIEYGDVSTGNYRNIKTYFRARD